METFFISSSFFFFFFLLITTSSANNIWSRREMVEMAGYGEHKLSSVMITGSLFSEKTAIPGATVAIKCHMSNKKRSKWIKSVTDESGDFVIHLPSHLHALPKLEKTCFVRPLYVPKVSVCYHQSSIKVHRGIKVVSSTNGFRVYSSGKIKLQGCNSRSSRGRSVDI